MKEQDQIKAIAEMDGIEVDYSAGNYRWRTGPDNSWNVFDLPAYLSSRDAIVPVIEKHFTDDTGWCKFVSQLYKVLDTHELPLSDMIEDERGVTFMMIVCKPSQLCEAMLRATGKWIE